MKRTYPRLYHQPLHPIRLHDKAHSPGDVRVYKPGADGELVLCEIIPVKSAVKRTKKAARRKPDGSG